MSLKTGLEIVTLAYSDPSVKNYKHINENDVVTVITSQTSLETYEDVKEVLKGNLENKTITAVLYKDFKGDWKMGLRIENQ